MEPEQTPFAAVTVHTSRLQRVGRTTHLLVAAQLLGDSLAPFFES